MTSDERIYRRDFWLGIVSARPVAIFRIALASVVLLDLLERLRDFHTFYTDRGLFPRSVALGDAWLSVDWSIFELTGSGWGVGVLYALGLLATAALLLGYRTRAANILTWIFLTSLQRRNSFVLDGSDTVERVLLFWLAWADSGAQLSLDVRLGRQMRNDAVQALPVRLIQMQIAAIYFFAAIEKSDVAWYGGGALERILQNPEMARPAAALLLHAPRLLRWVTAAIPPTELVIALLILSPFRRGRNLAFWLAVALHLPIFVFMAVGLFSIVMPLAVTIVRFPPPVTAPFPGRRWWHVIPAGAMLASLVCLSQTLLTGHCGASPRAITRFFALEQSWTMFSRLPGEVTLEWRAPGRFTDGAKTDDVFALALPRLRTPLRYWTYARWFKLREAMRRQETLPPMAGYVCRRVNFERSVKLETFRFEWTVHFQARLDSSRREPTENGVALLHDCLSTTRANGGR
jgi:hypothetical protein